jgi:hypothetical protein
LNSIPILHENKEKLVIIHVFDFRFLPRSPPSWGQGKEKRNPILVAMKLAKEGCLRAGGRCYHLETAQLLLTIFPLLLYSYCPV